MKLRQGLKCGWTVMDGVQALIFKPGRRPATSWFKYRLYLVWSGLYKCNE